MTDPNQTDTFYVIYDTVTDQYRNEDGDFGPYAEAERFAYCPSHACLGIDERPVGPCIEGEEP